MNTQEAVIYLMNNPKEKLVRTKFYEGTNADNEDTISMQRGLIKWSHGELFRLVYGEVDLREFEIVKSNKEKLIESISICLLNKSCTDCSYIRKCIIGGMNADERQKLLKILEEN